MQERLNNYNIVVAGAGRVFEEKVGGALDFLGPADRRIILDVDIQRLSQENLSRVNADVGHLPLSLERAPPEQHTKYVTFVATPDHLSAIQELVNAGFQRLIVEKPLVNNTEEVENLGVLMERHPEVKIYPLDFYVQKSLPLAIMTGALRSNDPRWRWVQTGKGEVVPPWFAGTLWHHIGQLEGLEVTIFEGGKFGLPDLEKRKWLEEDPQRGGMLLDLGTHTLAPLVTAGILSAENTTVVHAHRKILGSDRHSYVQAPPGQPEHYADALLTLKRDGADIPLSLRVGKTFHQGGMWELAIRGSKGHVFMGLRTGDSLMVIPKEAQPFQLRLRPDSDPYALAFQEAHMYFNDYPGFDGNLKVAFDSISIVDKIKSSAERG